MGTHRAPNPLNLALRALTARSLPLSFTRLVTPNGLVNRGLVPAHYNSSEYASECDEDRRALHTEVPPPHTNEFSYNPTSERGENRRRTKPQALRLP